jgi:hypothetical protein
MTFCNHSFTFNSVKCNPVGLTVTVGCEYCSKQGEFEININDFLDLTTQEPGKIELTWDSERDKEV